MTMPRHVIIKKIIVITNKSIQSKLVVDTCFMEALSIARLRHSDNVAERLTVWQIAKYR